MKLTPAMKGQLTKAVKRTEQAPEPTATRDAVRAIFAKLMPREQANHATKKFLAGAAR